MWCKVSLQYSSFISIHWKYKHYRANAELHVQNVLMYLHWLIVTQNIDVICTLQRIINRLQSYIGIAFAYTGYWNIVTRWKFFDFWHISKLRTSKYRNSVRYIKIIWHISTNVEQINHIAVLWISIYVINLYAISLTRVEF